MERTKRKNSRFKNAMIANDALIAAHDAYLNDPEAKKYRESFTRYADYVEKLEGLLLRFAHSFAQLTHYKEEDMRQEAKTERVNLKSLQSELQIIYDFRPDWNERYGLDENTMNILLADIK